MINSESGKWFLIVLAVGACSIETAPMAANKSTTPSKARQKMFESYFEIKDKLFVPFEQTPLDDVEKQEWRMVVHGDGAWEPEFRLEMTKRHSGFVEVRLLEVVGSKLLDQVEKLVQSKPTMDVIGLQRAIRVCGASVSSESHARLSDLAKEIEQADVSAGLGALAPLRFDGYSYLIYLERISGWNRIDIRSVGREASGIRITELIEGVRQVALTQCRETTIGG